MALASTKLRLREGTDWKGPVWMSSRAGDCYVGCAGRCAPSSLSSWPEIQWHGSYSENNRRLLAQRTTGLALFTLPDAASLIVTLLLSIGLWAAIWEAVDLLASAVLH